MQSPKSQKIFPGNGATRFLWWLAAMAFRGASNVEKHPSPLEVWIRPTTWMAFLCGSILWMTYHHLEQCPDVVFPCKVTKECVESPRKRRNGWKMENGPPGLQMYFLLLLKEGRCSSQSESMLVFRGAGQWACLHKNWGSGSMFLIPWTGSDPMRMVILYGYMDPIIDPIKKNPNIHYRFL